MDLLQLNAIHAGLDTLGLEEAAFDVQQGALFAMARSTQIVTNVFLATSYMRVIHVFIHVIGL